MFLVGSMCTKRFSYQDQKLQRLCVGNECQCMAGTVTLHFYFSFVNQSYTFASGVVWNLFPLCQQFNALPSSGLLCPLQLSDYEEAFDVRRGFSPSGIQMRR